MSHITYLRESINQVSAWLNRPILVLANLTIVGAFGSVLAAYIQYNSWRHEKNLTRYREELASAISNYSEISGALSNVMNLQQIMYYTYKNAVGHWGSIDKDNRLYLKHNGKWTHDQYHSERTKFRTNIDVLVGKADLFIDRPLRSDSVREGPLKEEPFIASERDTLRNNGFDCKVHVPDLQKENIQVRDIAIDWSRTKHHVATFYYCLEDIHTALLPVRIWAHTELSAVEPEPPGSQERNAKFAGKMADVEQAFSLQIKRLSSFITLSTSKIEALRLRERSGGFLRHQICWYCER